MKPAKDLSMNLREKKKQGKPIIIIYLPASYPDFKTSERWIKLLLKNGVDGIELGYPSNCPEMDGKVISKAHQEIRNNGFEEENYIDLAKEILASIPFNSLIAMGYWNELQKKFKITYKKQWIKIGLKYLLFPDINLEKKEEIEIIQKYGYKFIPFISDINTSVNYELFQESPFIYCPAYEGKTGNSGMIDQNHLIRLREKIKASVLRKVPALVGFGISKKEDAARVMELGYDGVVIGTAILEAFQEGEAKALELLEGIKKSMGGVSYG